jgi:hypothetical protein
MMMKKPFIISFLLLTAISVYGQKELPFFDQIILKQYENSTQFFDSEVNLCILDYEGFISKRDATRRFIAFFEENTPISYEISHTGSSKGGQSSYYVSRLKTSGGTFRLFVYFDKIGSQIKINELRIER